MKAGGRPAILGDNPPLSSGPGLASFGLVRFNGFSSGFSELPEFVVCDVVGCDGDEDDVVLDVD